MDQIVLDTSVIVKLFLKEEWSEIAIKLKDKHARREIEIMCPSIMKYELTNALKYKYFRKEEIKEALESIKNYCFSISDPEYELLDRVAELCCDYNISAYDASYVAFAENANTDLCTADEKLILKTKDLGFVKHVKEF